jgi:autotransporter-associated beta strand protein
MIQGRIIKQGLIILLLSIGIVLHADVLTWTGGPDGTGTTWNDESNWDGGVPGEEDTVLFTNLGLSDDKIITLGATQTVNTVIFDTTVGFTLGNPGEYPLKVCNINRTGQSSGTQIIKADILLESNTVWVVEGEGMLNVYKMTGPGSIEKSGMGELFLSGSNSSRSGATIVSAGTMSASHQFQLGTGDLTVGNGIDDALFLVRWPHGWNVDLFGNNATITVKDKGVLDIETFSETAGDRTDSVEKLVVDDGGLVKLGKWSFLMGSYSKTNVLLRGGTITATSGSLRPTSGHIAVDASAASMAVIDADLRVAYKWGDGALFTRLDAPNVPFLPVEMKVNGRLSDDWDDRDGIDKVGSGVVKLTGSNTYGGKSTSEGRTRVIEGILLIDNKEGSGTGKSYVPVSAGATLGGVGTIGGLESSPYANVVLTGLPDNPAVLAPGSIDEITGGHIFGTLTVGSQLQTNNVTFGNNSKLRIMLDAKGNHDRLTVYGVLSLDTPNDYLEIIVPEDAKPSTYVLVSASGGITGTFDNIEMPVSGVSLDYTDDTVELTVHSPGTVIIIQ